MLANTSPTFGDPANWDNRIQAVRVGGMAAIVDLVMERFFSEKTRKGNATVLSSVRSVLLGTDPAGYIGCSAALRDFDS